MKIEKAFLLLVLPFACHLLTYISTLYLSRQKEESWERLRNTITLAPMYAYESTYI